MRRRCSRACPTTCASRPIGAILCGAVCASKLRRGSEIVLKTGEVYYLEPGHVPLFEEDTEVLEFSPKKEYQQTIDVVNENIAAAQTKK